MLKSICLIFSVYVLIVLPATAKPVQLKNQHNKTVTADYLQGTNTQPAVLILHGFLQTREFSTVSRLANNLNEAGYTVLSPTLSLGLSNRKKSLSCEAIHTHTMTSDTAELAQWIDWLHTKTGKSVTLIGHSAGGPAILNYLQNKHNSTINHTILISLSYYASGPSANETPKHEAMAKAALSKKDKGLQQYALNYCKNYPTFASAFLSYYQWNKQKVASTVSNFKNNISIIIGTDDKRIDKNWRHHLDTKNQNVIAINGANHFFDKAYEFELTDMIEQLLAAHPRH